MNSSEGNATADKRVPIGECVFMPLGAVEGAPREFIVTLFSDRTCEWEDVLGRASCSADKLLEVKALIEGEAKLRMENEVAEFSVKSSIDDRGYHLILMKERYQAQGYEVTRAMSTDLDLTLAETFWSDVNPHIWKPLTRG